MTALTVPEVRRLVSRHRSWVAGGLAAAAVASIVSALAPRTAAGVPVLTAARDLDTGTALAGGDLRLTHMPAALAPSGALASAADAVGQRLAGAVRRGEPVTDIRLSGASLAGRTGIEAGDVEVPVRIPDPASVALLAVGDRVDVLAASTAAGAAAYAQLVAADAVVLAVPAAGADPTPGAELVLAASPTVAARLAAASVSSRLFLTVRLRP